MSKNLIYYTIGYDSNYVEMLDLHMKSLEKFNDGTFDCLIVTDDSTMNLIKTQVVSDITFDYHLTSPDSAFRSSANKLKIYDYEHISKYDNILFCDIDTLWNGHPNDVFKIIKDGKIYVTNEKQLMNHPAGYWGDYLLTQEQREDITERSVMAINGGVFGFKSSMAWVFKDIEFFLNDNTAIHNAVYEQPFLNVYLYTTGLIDNELNNFVLQYYYLDYETKHLIHFLGGSSDAKLNRMKNFKV